MNKKLIVGVLMSFSAAAFANGFDCRGVGSPHGGKFCHYRISQCVRDNVVDAAKCAVKEYSNQVSWEGVTTMKAIGYNVEANEMKLSVKTDNGTKIKVVTLEENEDGFLPVAMREE